MKDRNTEPKLGGPIETGTRRGDAILWLLQSRLGHGVNRRDLEGVKTIADGLTEYVYLDGMVVGHLSVYHLSVYHRHSEFVIDAQVSF